MTALILLSEALVVISLFLGVCVLILQDCPKNMPTNSQEASNNDFPKENEAIHDSDQKNVIIGSVSHEDLKCNYTPLTKDLNNIVKIDSIYLLREYFLLRPEFSFRELIDRMPFFYNVRTKEICEIKKLDKLFKE